MNACAARSAALIGKADVQSSCGRTTEKFATVVSKDLLRAWIKRPDAPGPGCLPISLEDVLAILAAGRLEIDDAVRARAAQYVKLVTAAGEGSEAGAPPEIPEQFLIAEGQLPTEAEDAVFEWAAELAGREEPLADEDRVDYFSVSTIKTVPSGTVIGRLVPPKDGAAGRNVHGQPVAPQRRQGARIEVGHGLRVSEERGTVTAETAGRPVFEHGCLRIDEVLEIPGDIDFSSGSLDVCIDVHVRGTVRSNFRVRTTESLAVDKMIEAAEVVAGGDITVRGGLHGGGADSEAADRVRAGGCVVLRFCNEATVRAEREVRVVKETINSRVRTRDRFVSPSGTIIGGDIWAREGMEVGVLGNDAGVVTRVAVGISPEVTHRVRALESSIRERDKRAQMIRQRIQPMTANLKRLTAQQREQATELVAKADELEAAMDDGRAERDRLLAESRPTGRPAVLVLGRVHPGVRVAIGERQARIDTLIEGPVKIEDRKVNGVTEMVAVSQRAASVTVLPSSSMASGSGRRSAVSRAAVSTDRAEPPVPRGGQ